MARPTNKINLQKAAQENFETLNLLIADLSEVELNTDFDFSQDSNKKEKHWERDKNLRDVLIHLFEWHQLLLTWIRANQKGHEVPFLPSPYNWRTYGDMNLEFLKKHQSTSLEDAKHKLKKSHHELMNLIDSFTDEELFSKGAFAWVGGSILASYFISSSSSHYAWAIKKIKTHRKNVKKLNIKQ